MGVADDHHTEPVVEVDVLVAVDVPDLAALAAVGEDGLRGSVLEGGGDTARLNPAGLAPELIGAPPAGAEPFLFARDQFIDAVSVNGYRGGVACQAVLLFERGPVRIVSLSKGLSFDGGGRWVLHTAVKGAGKAS
jgi:hypothetical protein